MINGFSHENSSDSNDKIFAKNNDVIGASLLPFLPSGRIDPNERKCEDGNDSIRHAVTMELDAGGLHTVRYPREILHRNAHTTTLPAMMGGKDAIAHRFSSMVVPTLLGIARSVEIAFNNCRNEKQGCHESVFFFGDRLSLERPLWQ